MDVYEKLRELGITLTPPQKPIAAFLQAKEFGDKLLYVSGTGPVFNPDGTPPYVGQVGGELTLEEGYTAARSAGIAILAILHNTIGDLNRVKSIVKVLGLVNSAPGFFWQPGVMNGFSDLMAEVFGDAGRHARSAMGTSSLPFNIPVEVEMLVELK
ncbi:hypothetical protein SDC9_145763 [bioreactor metagenome]|uniref:Endoribonuclease L-PSP/chorismate mutase-like domain-containing protein n=1 Tax=bioreactor metagenome TaxID=1076179 RepID=A0A645EAT7_9ZZZZ